MNTQEITATSFDFFWTLYEKEVFSEVQIQICNDVLIGLEDVTINEKYRLKSKGNISTCVNNAIRGNYWEPGKLCRRWPSEIHTNCAWKKFRDGQY